MTPFDPARPLTPGHVPAWRDAPHLALPSLVLTPTEREQVWDLKFMFPSSEHSGAFHWVGKEFSSDISPDGGCELVVFLDSWEWDPEETVKKYFGLEPPSGKVWTITKEDPLAELQTDKTAEELGL